MQSRSHQQGVRAIATKPNLLVLASQDSPELNVLDKIKNDVNIVGVGNTAAELEKMPAESWATVDVALACGMLMNSCYAVMLLPAGEWNLQPRFVRGTPQVIGCISPLIMNQE